MTEPRGTMNCVNPPCDVTRKINEDGSVSRLMMCGRCEKVSYCSKACQKEHWPTHKPACKALKDNPNWPTMNTIRDISEESTTALYSNHAPASERIRWHSLDEQNAITRLVNRYIQQLDKEQVSQCAAEKFLTYGKGAVMFNINYPVMQHKGSARFSYAGLGALKKTGDAVMTSIVRDYNPLSCCVMIFLKPSADLRSVDVWSLESYYPLPPFLQQEVREAIRDWDAMMAEESKKRDKKKKPN